MANTEKVNISLDREKLFMMYNIISDKVNEVNKYAPESMEGRIDTPLEKLQKEIFGYLDLPF